MNAPRRCNLGTCALGRALDARGAPLDDGPPPCGRRVAVNVRAPAPSRRAPIADALWTGIRAIDGLLTLGRGARIGVFGAPGSGKSVFVENLVAGCEADAVVVALVGERGREAQRWIGRRSERATIVCATSDRPAQERIDAACVAMAHAGALRERGLHVVLLLDSLARFAAALRETAVAAHESVGRGGYPPSVFTHLARLLEVAGELRAGSITVIATVLCDGDDRDPVSEAARSLLDGHVMLSSELAHAGRFPAVDVLRSASRTMDAVTDEEHRRASQRIRWALALLERVQDARSLGIEPSDRAAVAAMAAEPHIEAFLRQASAGSPWTQTRARLLEIAAALGEPDGNR